MTNSIQGLTEYVEKKKRDCSDLLEDESLNSKMAYKMAVLDLMPLIDKLIEQRNHWIKIYNSQDVEDTNESILEHNSELESLLK